MAGLFLTIRKTSWNTILVQVFDVWRICHKSSSETICFHFLSPFAQFNHSGLSKLAWNSQSLYIIKNICCLMIVQRICQTLFNKKGPLLLSFRNIQLQETEEGVTESCWRPSLCRTFVLFWKLKRLWCLFVCFSLLFLLWAT